MIIAAILIGLVILVISILCANPNIREKSDFGDGIQVGLFITMLCALEVVIVISIIAKPTPTAMDVYQGKTTLEYKVVDGVKVDSVVIFKNDDYGKN